MDVNERLTLLNIAMKEVYENRKWFDENGYSLKPELDGSYQIQTEQEIAFDKELSRRIANPPTHQHAYQVQVSDHVMVRWCVNCGKAWKCERPQNGSFFGDYWEPILEREESKE